MGPQMIPELQMIPGPQMIPESKWSLFWTGNDNEKKVRNGMEEKWNGLDRELKWIALIFIKITLNHASQQVSASL